MKRITALLLVLVLCIAFIPAVNAEQRNFSTVKQAAAYLTTELTGYSPEISFSMTVPVSATTEPAKYGKTMFNEMLPLVWKYDGNPVHGDYLKYQVDYISSTYTIGADKQNYYYNYVIKAVYRNTKEQEAELTEKLNEALPSIIGNCTNLYEKVKAIHDWVVKTNSYDYQNQNNNSNLTKYTAWAAACEGKSVCQGYAILFNRLCLMAGIDCRFIIGSARGGSHSWNRVEVGGKYYLVDTTWDDTTGTDRYFLKGERTFADHYADDICKTSEFAASQEDFSLENYDPAKDIGLRIAPDFVAGDVDCDGNVTVSDARMSLRIAIKLDSFAPDSAEYLAADVNLNGTVAVDDARKILRVAIQLDEGF